MSWMISGAAAILAALAAAGVLVPFGRARTPALEPADPLEDERTALLRKLRLLEQDHADGAVHDEDYQVQRADTESQAVAVLRALEARDRTGELADGLRQIRSARQDGDGCQPRRSSRRGLGLLLGVAIVVASLSVLVAGGQNGRPGPLAAASGSATPLSFFERRVREQPQDVAARLDLAQQLLDAGDVRGATQQYLHALQLDPRNPEANTMVGLLLYMSGLTSEGLRAVNRALQVQPNFPEALFVKGVILLRGLGEPERAAPFLRSYLETAPFGSYRSEAEKLLRLAEQEDTAEAGR
jgi:cytochrome c-type biogenesis protein CcmH/NrfG